MDIDSTINEQHIVKDYMLKNNSLTAAFEFENIIRKGFLQYRTSCQSYNMYIEKTMDTEIRVKLVNVLNTCDCCDRHQVNRPVKYEPWTNTIFNNTQDTDCECKCRHFSRFICRTCE